jgi:uncharacterized protein YqjF (DUF2071 family)
MRKVFLTAAWRKLIMANYAVDASSLAPYLPMRTELDRWNDTCYVSLVGFMFLNTRLKGIRIPFHSDFEEVNLRFYVRFKEVGEWKRGTVFIKEMVPKPAISFVANTVYGENYETRSMSSSWAEDLVNRKIKYAWKKHNWNSMNIVTEKHLLDMGAGTEEEFITEHYWGLSKGKNNITFKYAVDHPRWQIYKTIESSIDVDFKDNYGAEFAFLNQEDPVSVFLAEGSEILVRQRQVLDMPSTA